MIRPQYRIGKVNLILKDIYGNGTTASTLGGPVYDSSKGGAMPRGHDYHL
jgi:hypothetical protein